MDDHPQHWFVPFGDRESHGLTCARCARRSDHPIHLQPPPPPQHTLQLRVNVVWNGETTALAEVITNEPAVQIVSMDPETRVPINIGGRIVGAGPIPIVTEVQA